MGRPIPIADIADWLHSRKAERKAVVMLQTYHDAGSSSIVGYVATKAAWVAVENAWNKGFRFTSSDGLQGALRNFDLTPIHCGQMSFDKSFSDLAIRLSEWAKSFADGEKVAVIFRHKDEYEGEMDSVDKALRQNVIRREVFGSIAFGCEADVVPLQIVSFLADHNAAP